MDKVRMKKKKKNRVVTSSSILTMTAVIHVREVIIYVHKTTRTGNIYIVKERSVSFPREHFITFFRIFYILTHLIIIIIIICKHIVRRLQFSRDHLQESTYNNIYTTLRHCRVRFQIPWY